MPEDAAARVLAGLGPAFVAKAGDLLPDLVAALTAALQDLDDLATTGGRAWPAVVDLDTTPAPRWLGAATGTPVPVNASVEEARAIVRDRSSWRRGTAAAMQAAAREVYPDGMITFVERDGSPWQATIRLYAASATSEDQARVAAAAAEHKPVGIVLTVEIASGASYAHLIDEAPTYAALKTLYPTYRAMRAHIPEEGTVP